MSLDTTLCITNHYAVFFLLQEAMGQVMLTFPETLPSSAEPR